MEHNCQLRTHGSLSISQFDCRHSSANSSLWSARMARTADSVDFKRAPVTLCSSQHRSLTRALGYGSSSSQRPTSKHSTPSAITTICPLGNAWTPSICINVPTDVRSSKPPTSDPRAMRHVPKRCWDSMRSEEHTSELQSLRHLV